MLSRQELVDLIRKVAARRFAIPGFRVFRLRALMLRLQAFDLK